MKSHDHFRFFEELSKRSVASTWEKAREEWTLQEIHKEEKPEVCLCGHSPIYEFCVVKNRYNNNSAIVGNVCAQKFLGLPFTRIFAALQRVSSNLGKPLNPEVVEHAFSRGWFDEAEYNFYMETWRKHGINQRQGAKRVLLNERVLKNLFNPQAPESKS